MAGGKSAFTESPEASWSKRALNLFANQSKYDPAQLPVLLRQETITLVCQGETASKEVSLLLEL
jgi:hypothetical protein